MFGIFSKDDKDIEELIANKDFDQLSTEQVDEIAKNLILTTEFAMPEYKVTERLEIITAECVFGMNMFRDMFASIRDIVGGRSKASQKVLRDARRTCLTELRREALISGADAVIGVDLDYAEISGDGKSMLMVIASGTAVKIQPV